MIDLTITLRSESQVKTACNKIREAWESGKLHQCAISLVKEIRTDSQNKMYWSALDERLKELNLAIMAAADMSGHTPMEIRAIFAQRLEPEYIGILYVRNAEAVHEILKVIGGVPTSTKLTKATFSDFYERMEVVMSEVIASCHP